MIHVELDAKVLTESSTLSHFESLLVELIDELVNFIHVRGGDIALIDIRKLNHIPFGKEAIVMIAQCKSIID